MTLGVTPYMLWGQIQKKQLGESCSLKNKIAITCPM